MKPDPIFLNSFTLSWVDKVTTGAQSFASVIVIVGSWFAIKPAIKNSLLTKLT